MERVTWQHKPDRNGIAAIVKWTLGRDTVDSGATVYQGLARSFQFMLAPPHGKVCILPHDLSRINPAVSVYVPLPLPFCASVISDSFWDWGKVQIFYVALRVLFFALS